MQKIEVKGDVRKSGKKGACRKLRAAGSIPVVVYGHNVESLAVAIKPDDLIKALSTEYGPNIVFDIVLNDEGKEIRRPVMVKCLQRHPVTRRILHADLYAIDPERDVTVHVPLSLEGRSVGVAAGGELRQAARDVVVSCHPSNIPVKVVLDTTALNIRERVKISQVPRPEGCEFVYLNDFLVCEIYPPRK